VRILILIQDFCFAGILVLVLVCISLLVGFSTFSLPKFLGRIARASL
jgi:hypothetical protein